ncbi:Relaxase (plasmid) [Rhodoferax ferrireducens T118]|uniref:Relaxase n=1 Tax=Albidiferax ferrireducens (strain ATCC BAA-621 / DSM 15236 / T118) TaxID=338969 RepID=Q21QJ1_ALBFT|nr:MobH family relaxase [Rhodoferax ferrireducens]ABD71954.1 Relaxase [Rhodoferax ferrireducens T118]
MRFSDVFSFIKRTPRKVIPVPSSVRVTGIIPTAMVQVVAPESSNEPGVPRYPPMDSGIRLATPDDVLATQADLIRLLKRNLGIANDDFERRYLAPLRRAAELINLIPATRDKHHTGAGGLFRFAATMAIRSAQSADGRIFAANEGIERRRQTEAAWRHAAFLTGLTCELFRPLTEMMIFDPKGNQWSPFVAPLTEWARQQGADRFFVRWHQHDDARSVANTLSSWAVNAVVGNEVLSELNNVNSKIVETIFGVSSGSITTADNSTMAALINDVRRRVITQDHEIAPATYGKLTSGSQLEPYFMDAMRTLLRTGVWQVNTKSGRCHFGADGFYVAWRMGSQEILGHLQTEKIAGVPTAKETLAEMMGRAGIISIAPDGSWIHLVRSSVGASAPMPAVRIQSPLAILGHLEVKPVADTLRVNSAKPAPSVAIPLTKPDVVSVAPALAKEVQEIAILAPKSDLKAKVLESVDQETGEIAPVVASKPAAPEPPKTSAAAPAPASDVVQQVKPAVAAKRAPSAKPGIPTVPDVDDLVQETFDTDMLLELGAPICREVAAWRDLWNRGQSSQEFLRTTEGLAVSYAVVNGSAIQLSKIMEALKGAGYIEISNLNGTQRTLTPIPFPKKTELGLVLRTNFARKAGFILE